MPIRGLNAAYIQSSFACTHGEAVIYHAPRKRKVLRLIGPWQKIMGDQGMTRIGMSICTGAMIAATAASGVANAAAADDASDTLQEITITAEKQTENLQKTAADVTAISADQLVAAGVTDLREAQMVVPAVRFQAEGNNTQVFVRGVGANLDFANVEPNVAFNFAGTYLPREATSAAFFDVAQLEILPGSQGTLYGRSAIGGTIVMTPAKPGFNNEGETLL